MNNLAHYRKMAGLTQAELSEKTGIPESALCRAEKGVSDMTGQRWRIAAEALECSIDSLLVRKESDYGQICPICNCDVDEKGSGGLWDLAGEICDEICSETDHNEQDTVYGIIRNFIESEKFCSRCGKDMTNRKDKEND